MDSEMMRFAGADRIDIEASTEMELPYRMGSSMLHSWETSAINFIIVIYEH